LAVKRGDLIMAEDIPEPYPQLNPKQQALVDKLSGE
jgi:hypothetical protein